MYKRILVVLTTVSIIFCYNFAIAERVQWKVEDGGNGHYYEQIAYNGNWFDANSEAKSMGGYLVTITSNEENLWIQNNIVTIVPGWINPWIGLYQDKNAPDYSEPAGGWKWVTGEPFVYSNWRSGEPNNGGNTEQAGQIFGTPHELGLWNDFEENVANTHFIMEWGEPDSNLEVVLIMAESLDKNHRDDYKKTDYEDVLDNIKEYYSSISYNKMSELIFTILDNNGEWYKLDYPENKYNEKSFVKEAIDKANNDINNFTSSNSKIILVAHSGRDKPLKDLALPSLNAASVSEFSGLMNESYFNIGTYAHEIGHILGKFYGKRIVLPDLYEMGNMNKKTVLNCNDFIVKPKTYDLMAGGSHNAFGEKPSQMSSFTKELMGWLHYENEITLEMGNSIIHNLKSLEKMDPNDTILKIRINDHKYYIMEVRSANEWDEWISKEGMVIYEVNTKGKDTIYYNSNPFDKDKGIIYNWRINIKYVLQENEKAYYDFWNQMEFSVVDFDEDEKELEIKVEKKQWKEKIIGFVMEGMDIVLESIQNTYFSIPDDVPMPDLDLHVYTGDGKHIGVNYDTEEYEIQIPGALASGDMLGTEEWILLPEYINDYRFFVSAHDIEAFIKNFPEALNYTDGSDYFRLTGVINSPEKGCIYESDKKEFNIFQGERIELFLDYKQNYDGSYKVKILKDITSDRVDNYNTIIFPRKPFINIPSMIIYYRGNQKNLFINNYFSYSYPFSTSYYNDYFGFGRYIHPHTKYRGGSLNPYFYLNFGSYFYTIYNAHYHQF